jgi:hypothetical protein
MIPDFDEHGYLPPGAHPAALDEIAERFGQSTEIRRVQMESLRWLVDLSRRAGVSRLIVNGSFVTDVLDPNDVDCVLLIGPKYPLDLAADKELHEGLPFVTMELVTQRVFELYVNEIFGTDRLGVRKGMVEVAL